MNKAININKKQLKLLAIEVLLHNLKSDYDRRNRFDDYVVRVVVDIFVKDGYEVILNPAKYIEEIERALDKFDAYELAVGHYNSVLSSNANQREINKRGVLIAPVQTEKSIEDAFLKCRAWKIHIRKRMNND